jgi:flagellar motor switch protein FliN/FliY
MEESEQSALDSVVSQLQTGAKGMADDAARALESAAQTAQSIAVEIQGISGTGAGGEGAGGEVRRGAAALPVEGPNRDLVRLLAIEVPVIVQLGRRRMTVAEVMRFAVGAIIEFSKSADEDLELLANNKAIGKGHAVKVGENFGIKISAISPVKETIRKLGGA